MLRVVGVLYLMKRTSPIMTYFVSNETEYTKHKQVIF